MLLNELKKLKLKKELITIRRSCGEDDLTGEISDVNEHYVAFILWTDDGEFDGLTVFETDQIDELFWGNREHLAISILIEKNGKRPNITFDSSTFKESIFEAYTHHSHLCIYHEHGEDTFDICNLVQSDETWMKIQTFGAKRSLSRLMKLIQLDEIIRFTIMSPYQNNIVSLHGSKL